MIVSCPNCSMGICFGWLKCLECGEPLTYRANPPNRVRISIITEMVFATELEFHQYLDTPEMQAITSFPEELKLAFDTQEPVNVETPRPQYGAVTRSEVRADKIS